MSGTDTLYKILAVERIIQAHPYGITVKEIIEALKNEYGITAERKDIYSNIQTLTRFMPIDTYKEKNNRTVYFIRKI